MRRLSCLTVLGLLGCSSEGGGGGVGPDGNHFPEVMQFNCSPQSGFVPLKTECAWVIRDLDAEQVRCVIDVDADGTTEHVIDNCPTSSSVNVTAGKLGASTVRLFLVDARSATASADAILSTVQPPNQAPTLAGLTATPDVGGQPLPVTLRFTVADQENDAMTCRVVEGDQVLANPSACSGTDTRNVLLVALGAHTVTVEVTDAMGGRASMSVPVTVLSKPQIGDLRISKVEWGQTVLSPNLRLVAGKDALLRVHVLSQQPGITDVRVIAEASRNGTALGEVALTGPNTPPTVESPTDLNQTWRGTVPAAWIASGLSVRVRVDPNDVMGETDESNNEQVLNPAVGAGSVLPITHVPIVQSGRTGTPRNIDQAMRQIWPLKGTDNKTRAAYTFNGTIAANGGGWDSLISQLEQVRRNDGSRRDYLGWISVTFGSGVAGLGFVGIGVALTRDDEIGTSVHELGHNMGREHAPCGGAGGPDRNYPVANARLDVPGYDFVSGRVIVPSQSFDVMSYCDPIWVSAYNYRAVQSFLENNPVSSSSPITAAPRIVINGRVQKGGKVILNPITLIEGPQEPEPPLAGDYLLTLHGERTVTVPFGLAQVADGLDEGQFAMLLPEVPGLYAAEISAQGKTVALRLAGPPRPAQKVAVRQLNGGVELTWDSSAFPFASLSHLGEEGHTTLALWLEGGKAFVSTQGVPDLGQFEVSLSDGVQSQRLVIDR